jgi:hypothetical protein
LGNDSNDCGQHHEIYNLYIHDTGNSTNNQGIYFLASDTLVDGCVIERTSGNAISLFVSGGATPRRNVIRNCIFTATGRLGPNGRGIIMAGGSGHTLERITCYNNPGDCIVAEAGVGPATSTTMRHISCYLNSNCITISHASSIGNLIQNVLAIGDGISMCGMCGTLGTNMTSGTPTTIWVNPTAGDLRLRAGSPAIDACPNIGLTSLGSAPDCGYHEFGSGGDTTPPAAPRALVVSKLEVR